LILGLAGAALTAVCYGFGSILQSMAATETQATDRFDVIGVGRLVSQWRYVGGLALDVLGFAASVAALRTLPLFVVQAAIASSVGVTALASARFLGAQMTTRERRALVGLFVGLVLLGIAGRPEHGSRLAEPGPVILLVVAAVVAAGAFVLARSAQARSAAVLAASAGLSFGAVGIGARGFVVPDDLAHAFADPLLYAIAVHGLIATMLFAAALQRGNVTTVAAVTFAVETVVPAVVGLVWLGDHARAGLAPVAFVGFILTVAASIALARFSAPDR
jgi:drug/metabolite transporter (DMT)-like permease